MREVIIIGTIHTWLTPHQELAQILSDLKPDQIFVELTPGEVKETIESDIKLHRDEMAFVWKWVQSHKIKVYAFDAIITHELKPGITGKEKDFKEILEKERKVLKKYSWKELNKKEPWLSPELAVLEKEIDDKYINLEGADAREKQMLVNILENMVPA